MRLFVKANLLWLLAVTFAYGTASATVVSDVRHSVRDGQTRVVIDMSKEVSYEIVGLDGPDRIAVNIRGAGLSRGVHQFDVTDGVVARVRFNRLSWGTQVVLDLREHSKWLDFHLSAVDDMPPRIVIDVDAASAGADYAEPVDRERPHTGDAGLRPFLVAVDAGHGGSDPGAVRGSLVEKRAALEIATRIADDINKRPGYSAFLTRTGDEFLSLTRRTEIAKEKNADIFVSIHLNSAPKRSARGAEVFFLSPSGAEATASRFLANKSKAAEALGVQGRSSSDILYMLVDVNQQSMMQRSSLLAEEILNHIDHSGLPPARSVKQRSFAVLKSIDMPSVIVEAGFVTNSTDAAILKSASGRTKVASAITDGVVSFLKKYPPPRGETGRVFVHRVQRGDTLWRISRKYNTTVASIQESNRLGGSKLIRVGQDLVIREGYESY